MNCGGHPLQEKRLNKQGAQSCFFRRFKPSVPQHPSRRRGPEYRQALKEPFWNEEDYELMARFDGDIAEPQPEEDMFPGQLHL